MFGTPMGANSKHNDWDLRCYQMRYEFTPLAIETGGRQAEVTEAFLTLTPIKLPQKMTEGHLQITSGRLILIQKRQAKLQRNQHIQQV